MRTTVDLRADRRANYRWHRFAADTTTPRCSRTAAGSAQGRYREFGLHLYYRDERLAGVAVDALCGPQVFADGMSLVGWVPSELERWMLERADARPPHTDLMHMGAGVPASDSLGVTINVQRNGDRLLTRPIFYPAQALDDLPHWPLRDAWTIL